MGSALSHIRQPLKDKCGWLASVSLLLRGAIVTFYVLFDCHQCCHQLATSLIRYLFTLEFVFVIAFQPYQSVQDDAYHLIGTACLYVITTLFWEAKCTGVTDSMHIAVT